MSARTYARVDLTIDGDWRVGSWCADDATGIEDRAVVTIATLGEDPYLPGSSVRGALRTHLVDTLGERRTAEVFGPEPPGPGKDELFASPWWVLAARVVAGTWELRERKQTAISRHRRAPAKGSLRTSRSVGTLGTEPHIQVYLRCDSAADSAVARDVLNALANWRPRIGGGKSVGMGRARVTGVRYRGVALDSREGLLARVTGNDPGSLDALVGDARASAVSTATEEQPVLLACVFDLPHGWATPDDPAASGRKVFDGSTWKGVMRSRVEFIARSIGMDVCGDDRNGPVRACGACDMCTVFGSPESAGVLDFSSTPVARSERTSHRVRQRVALNRFTGGARDELLYKQGSEHSLSLRLEVRDLARANAPAAPPWVIRALAHAVRDLADGLIGVGVSSGTGLGTLAASSCQIGVTWREHLGDTVHNDGTLELASLDRLPVEATR